MPKPAAYRAESQYSRKELAGALTKLDNSTRARRQAPTPWELEGVTSSHKAGVTAGRDRHIRIYVQIWIVVVPDIMAGGWVGGNTKSGVGG